MTEIKHLLDNQGHGVLEMPAGNGKTVCLLSICLSYIKHKNPNLKLVYCTRTAIDTQKTLEELKFVQKQRETDFKDQDLSGKILALCISNKKNMCIHPQIRKQEDKIAVESLCRELTSPWNRL